MDESKRLDLDDTVLSGREVQIVQLAIDGLTDQQIGHRLGITASTVNSYWVRIRGKLGHLSRTDLVSRLLQQRSTARVQELEARVQELERELAAAGESLANLRDSDLLRAMLEACPEAKLALDAEGQVIFANHRALQLFGYSREEMIGQPLARLFNLGARSEALHPADLRSRLGVHEPLFGRRKSGGSFRAIVLADQVEGPAGTVHGLLVRDFFQEVDSLRRRAGTVAASLA